MHLSDNEFFEQYKRLDKLCSEMYSCRNGVSEYIAQMESSTHQGQYRVSEWDSDYKMLKHVRWVRNQIAHDSGTYQISTSEDLTFVRDYYNRIFSGQDSLTLLRKANEADTERRRQQKKQQANQTQAINSPHPSAVSKLHTKESHGWVGILIGVGVLALIIILFCILH